MTRRRNSREAPASHPPTSLAEASAPNPARTPSGAETIARAFAKAEAEGRAALMPYMMAGFPDRETSLAVAEAYVDGGADLIELGVPFSDPLADGPTIHAAATTALANGATIETAFEACHAVAGRVPVVLMAYSNMILAEDGAAAFGRRAVEAGAAGVIVPDLPLDEAEEARRAFDEVGLALVPLLAPTNSPQRRAQICGSARGFVYVVSTVGTTGERDELPAGLTDLIGAAKQDAEVPVAVGFGIGTPEQAATVGAAAEGVIIGSRLVRAAGEAGSPEAAADAVRSFLRDTLAAL